jgi:hypothetical protein
MITVANSRRTSTLASTALSSVALAGWCVSVVPVLACTSRELMNPPTVDVPVTAASVDSTRDGGERPEWERARDRSVLGAQDSSPSAPH